MKCVLLERVAYSATDGEQTRRQEVVLLGYHTDRLWNDSWIVHELAGDLSAPGALDNLAAIGCELGPADPVGLRWPNPQPPVGQAQLFEKSILNHDSPEKRRDNASNKDPILKNCHWITCKSPGVDLRP